MNQKNIALFLLFLVGVVLRIVDLGSYPSGFFRDEAALGYNAYSIWLTGRDEYGIQHPIVFRSFEVFFLPLYVYIDSLFVGLLGLNEMAVRLPSAISGVVLLALGYLIAKEIWGKRTAVLSVLILAIAPWHVFYSRGAFEGNLALTLFSAGFLFWLKFLRRNRAWTFTLSLFFFALSMYSYQSERLVVPLFGAVAVALFRHKLWKVGRELILPSMLIVVLLVPLLSLSLKAGGYHRVVGVSIFSEEKQPPGWIEQEAKGLLVNNTHYLRLRQITALYLSYFSPRNLFVEGDYDKQRSVENFSVFYSWMLPFLVVGLVSIARFPSQGNKLLLIWMLLSPLPAALTSDPFHTYRSLLVYMPLSLTIAVGLRRAIEWTGKTKAVLLCVATVSAVSTATFLFNYFLINQTVRARAWDYGYKELIHSLSEFSGKEQVTKVVVDDPWTEAYVHFLFFAEIDPLLYQEEVTKAGYDMNAYYTDSSEIRPNKFQNFEFRTVDWPSERGNSGTVFAIYGPRLPESEFATDPKITLLKEIKYPDGSTAFRVVQVK